MASSSLGRMTGTPSLTANSLPVLGASFIKHPGVLVRCLVFMLVSYAVCSLLLWEAVIHTIPFSFFVRVCVCICVCNHCL